MFKHRSILDADWLAARTKVDVAGCWLWTRGTDKEGYGSARVNYEMIRAHRAAWIIFRGPIPAGLLVCHRCDVPRCCNPEHLFLGTTKDNLNDARIKGRKPWGVVVSERARARGERNGKAKLSVEKILLIRASQMSSKKLAPNIQISASVIRKVRQRKLWAHVKDANALPA
jgi:hypothetical protein